MNLCNWDNLDEEIGRLTAAIRLGKANSSPFALLSLTDSPDDQLTCARTWVRAKLPHVSKTRSGGEIRRHDKIRVGYVSPDFRKHPVGYLTAGIFESHDPDRFETYAFSIGPDDNSDLRKRLEKSFHRFVDCEHKLDGDVLKAIDDAQIDILVDLAGHTHNARLSLFASSPAPIVVSYLGFAGTLGSRELVDYIIADHIVLPDQNRQFFDEKAVRLPGSFMPRDNHVETIDDAAPNRADHDLRQEWTVFCCFNNAYKINPAVFDSWMNILKGVDQSILWLSDVGEVAKSNLRKEAKIRGVDPDRLVFARRVASSSEHLARHRLADLFLDTLPYNAHTTASDALWAGLPVVTHIGNSFAGRVAASLLSAVGLPELITRTRADYEALAIDLALDKQKLADIRGRLQGSHLTASLFDAALYARRLETAYEAMYQRHQAGLPPDHIEVQARG
jgi:predicted O-linked N-acetylglucosamine transferase (SPINDLY family)